MTNEQARKDMRVVHIEQEISNTNKIGYFHTWAHNKGSELCALVELEDGSVGMYPIMEYHIVFEDKVPTVENVPV